MRDQDSSNGVKKKCYMEELTGHNDQFSARTKERKNLKITSQHLV